MYTGPKLNMDNLVFGYDTGYGVADNTVTTRFYQGKPSTNLVSAYNDNHVRHVTWTNSGTWEYDHNATNNTKPIIPGVDMSKCNLMHGKTVTTGSQHFGCGSVSVSGSTTYSMSVYYFQNKAGISQPYFRTSVNNNNLGNLAYNGSTDTNNWPVNEWIRISVTVTVQSNETGCYLSNYIGSAVGDQVWYCAPMVEQADQTTPFVDGTRSVTASLIDLKRTTSIDVSDLSFNSNAQPTFDGTDDVINLPNDLGYSANSVSVFAWYKINGSPGNSYHIICGDTALEISIHSSATYIRTGVSTTSGRHVQNDGNQTLNDGNYHYYGFTFDGSTKRAYIDGVQVGTQSVAGTLTTSFSGRKVGAFSGGYWANGDLPVYKVYNKVLTAEEIKNNFNAYKNRFDL
jgi:hypothetical protein